MSLLTVSAVAAGIQTNDIWQTIATILFALSMISERIANLFKLHQLPLGDITNRVAYKKHERAVSWYALGCGIVTSTLAGADLFTLLESGKLLACPASLPAAISCYWDNILSVYC